MEKSKHQDEAAELQPTSMIQGVLTQSELGEVERSGSFDAIAMGEQLHALRKSRKLTLQDMARQTGVSASAVSKIERGEFSPTLGTMQRIAEGLKIDIVSLLSGTSNEVQPYGRRSVNSADSGRQHLTSTCVNRLLSPDLREKRMLPVRTTVTARHVDDYIDWARSDSEIFLFVLSGILVLHSRAYEPLRLKMGESVYYDANIQHAWTSEGDTDAEVLWLISTR
ncbi:helix-turn-helix domain-containing protein [Aerobium aerolatum]|uniref:Transcriptional regulator, XRE family with cupin sensor n=1 Tax=Aquamicrobium aerolatum DSM 21857 TaxID=1121003 RepID=A0A1I3R6M4_9HYPH|nr:XRE family transcriptional regulator [Aquamicrobium aerolatum]SFJ42264.1 transcriptional regulator, XRE family with cupin sensor [Aquamicrobium aerolatum DSM 21857]